MFNKIHSMHSANDYLMFLGLQFSAENTELLTTLGLLFLQNGEYHKAFELLGKALTYDPENYKVTGYKIV